MADSLIETLNIKTERTIFDFVLLILFVVNSVVKYAGLFELHQYFGLQNSINSLYKDSGKYRYISHDGISYGCLTRNFLGMENVSFIQAGLWSSLIGVVIGYLRLTVHDQNIIPHGYDDFLLKLYILLICLILIVTILLLPVFVGKNAGEVKTLRKLKPIEEEELIEEVPVEEASEEIVEEVPVPEEIVEGYNPDELEPPYDNRIYKIIDGKNTLVLKEEGKDDLFRFYTEANQDLYEGSTVKAFCFELDRHHDLGVFKILVQASLGLNIAADVLFVLLWFLNIMDKETARAQLDLITQRIGFERARFS